MKEYIVRNELTTITEIREDGTEYTYIPYSVIEDAETVTKADICREWELDVLKNIEIGIKSTGHSDQYSTGFCNGLIWLRSCITGEEPEFLEMEQGESEIERTLKSFNDCEQSYLQSAT